MKKETEENKNTGATRATLLLKHSKKELVRLYMEAVMVTGKLSEEVSEHKIAHTALRMEHAIERKEFVNNATSDRKARHLAYEIETKRLRDEINEEIDRGENLSFDNARLTTIIQSIHVATS